jgi:hypothetical protein
MAANALALSERRELASRSSDDLEVTLWWDPRIDAVAVSIWDWKRDTHFELAADRHRALDVFYHPFSYTTPRDQLDDAMTGAL